MRLGSISRRQTPVAQKQRDRLEDVLQGVDKVIPKYEAVPGQLAGETQTWAPGQGNRRKKCPRDKAAMKAVLVASLLSFVSQKG